jgi:CO/xanthine dehydrogenase Mo-binding subunit
LGNSATSASESNGALAAYCGSTVSPWPAAGHGFGLVCHRSFHSYVATAVHVVVNDKGNLRAPQVDTVIDCGR